MTSPYVRTRPATWRLLLVALTSVAGAPAGVVGAWIAAVVWSGCFIECSGGDHLQGGALWLLAIALLLAGPVLAWLLLRRAVAVLASVAAGVATVGFAALVIGAN
jgi:low affinity Fe/Cu permease